MKNLQLRLVGEAAAVVVLATALSSCANAGSPLAAAPAGGINPSSPASSVFSADVDLPNRPLIGTIAKGSAVPERVSGAGQAPRQLLFVTNLDGSIRLYPADIHNTHAKLVGTITKGATRTEGDWIDSKGTLYVENGAQYPAQASVEEYKHGATSPFRTITEGLNLPGAVAVGKDGTVYVNQLGQGGGGTIGVVIVYPPGGITPERTIPLNPTPEYGMDAGGMAMDAEGNVYAATFGNAGEVHVFKIAPGSSQATDLGVQGYGGSAIAVDGAGNLYTAGFSGFIAVYAPGAIFPSRIIPADFSVYGMIAKPNGTLYAVADRFVAEYAPGTNTPINYVDTLYGSTFSYDAAIGSL
jgi:hypothetical protein